MDTFNLYSDISERTNGDIYFGVVGPVRTGKSTFIKRFMELLVLPNIDDKNKLMRTVDELPQSADGKTIMTTQPKFVPNEGIEIIVNDNVQLNVRLIDCVGYMVDGALGVLEGDKQRKVKTPWQDEPMPFEQAAEVGTTKVICDHSTIGVLVTTDGSIADIPRSAYLEAEEKAVNELKKQGKPFIIVLNVKEPSSASTENLKQALTEKYGVPVIALSAPDMEISDIEKLIQALLLEFPIVKVSVNLPGWLRALPYDNSYVKEIIDNMKKAVTGISKMSESAFIKNVFDDSEFVTDFTIERVDMAEGEIVYKLQVDEGLFYKILSDIAGFDISNELSLMKFVAMLKEANKEYSKLKQALFNAKEKGYGVVEPTFDEMELMEPEIVRQQGRVGVRLRASAPSLHIMRVDVNTEVNPIVNSEQQGEEMVKYLLAEFETNKLGIWQTNIFGKSLSELVREGLSNKLHTIPTDAQAKLRKTMARMINEGKGGMICILL